MDTISILVLTEGHTSGNNVSGVTDLVLCTLTVDS